MKKKFFVTILIYFLEGYLSQNFYTQGIGKKKFTKKLEFEKIIKKKYEKKIFCHNTDILLGGVSQSKFLHLGDWEKKIYQKIGV